MTIKLFKIDEVFDDKDLIAGFFSSHIAFHPTKFEKAVGSTILLFYVEKINV
jgi:hypothetical protein